MSLPSVAKQPVITSLPTAGNRWLRSFWRGLISLLGVVGFPLGYFWCRGIGDLQTTERMAKGCVFVLPGIQGKSPLEFAIARGLNEGGVESAIKIHDWTTGCWPLFLFHLRASFWHRRAAQKLAANIVAYQTEFPNRPVTIVGHSGGGGLSLMTAELLDKNRPIDRLVLLAPAVSPYYDLAPAIARTRSGIANIYSPFDCFLLGIGTIVAGSMDGWHTVAAGMCGFRLPKSLEEAPQVQQKRFSPRMLKSWNGGGHFGCVNRVFVANMIAPIICEAKN